tara:strand:+ start:231 stop:1001 length:771 start_codon:yes stop_codon:yes gene_type:complete
MDEYFRLNSKNILISVDQINTILKTYGLNQEINHKNRYLYNRALTHKSYVVRNQVETPDDVVPFQRFNNERLEYLGDSIISSVVARYLYLRYNTQNEGFLTSIRTKIVKGPTLAKLAQNIGLDKYLLISSNMETNGGRRNVNLLENAMESWVGAILLDKGFEACSTFFINVIEKHIDITDLIMNDKNYKDMLLQLFQKQKWGHPTYDTEDIDKKLKTFTMIVKNPDNQIIGRGTANTKKQAEQLASRMAIDALDKN